MNLVRILSLITGVVLSSCYYFPFVLAAFPIANSKMIMAATGIALFIANIFKHRGENDVDKSFLTLSLWALGVSLISWVATVVNNTHDYTFATYIVSMWVWIGGGYTMVAYIRRIHGGVSVGLVANYLIAVCVAQCVLAMVFDNVEAASAWQQRTFTGEAYMGATEDKRLAGIGCALDVAGLRFSAVLIMAAVMAVKAASRGDRWPLALYLMAICVITIIGNMIARTTAVGSGIALAYLAWVILFGERGQKITGLASMFMTFLFFSLVCSSILYNVNQGFHNNIRFGFEGFFSLVETGEWQTHSNSILKNMVVWPDNLKTWLIGDGYIENPLDKSLATFDPYYVGPSFGGYYMQTDIGYCRYIFYFGLIGLAAFCLYFIKVAHILASRFPSYKWMFFLILAMNFIGWCKVSSDLFMAFAPFLCITLRDEREAEAKSDEMLATTD